MHDIPLYAGTTPLVAMVTTHSATGAAVNADSTPTVAFYGVRLGAVVTAAELGEAVANVATGLYSVKVTINTVITNNHFGDAFFGIVTSVIGGITQKTPIGPFRFVPTTEGGKVVSDASNSANSFKIAIVDSGNLLTDTDDPQNTLLVFATGANAGRIRKVTAFNTGTNFITVSLAFEDVPAAGDAFFLINY